MVSPYIMYKELLTDLLIRVVTSTHQWAGLEIDVLQYTLFC